MSDLWVYVDESQAPHAGAVEAGQPFWVGSFITAVPVEDALTGSALDRLRTDPDSQGNRLDRDTLARGFFHASADSKNAHSWICRAIVDAGFDAEFSTAQWYFDRPDSHRREGADLHRLNLLLSVLAATQDDYDVVHIRLAQRAGTMDRHHVDRWAAYFDDTTFGGLVRMPWLPARFPRLDISMASGDDPGIQVCDFILWAVQRARPDGFDTFGNADWMTRLSFRALGYGGATGSAQQGVHASLGRGIARRGGPPPNGPRARGVENLSDLERWCLTLEIVQDVRSAAYSRNTRIEHLSAALVDAMLWCQRARRGDLDVAGEALNRLMTVFLRVCDTLPVYDRNDGVAWARAVEKRCLAGAFLTGELRLWMPDDFRAKL